MIYLYDMRLVSQWAYTQQQQQQPFGAATELLHTAVYHTPPIYHDPTYTAAW